MNGVMHVESTELTVRPIDITDVGDLARMFERLSRESIYYRFFSPFPRVPDTMLRRMTDVDHLRRDVLVALAGTDIVAMASYDKLPAPTSREAEIAVVVEDAWQHRGVALRLMCQLSELARERGLRTFVARTLPSNRAALATIRKLAPHSNARFIDGEYEVRLRINDLGCERSLASAERPKRCLS